MLYENDKQKNIKQLLSDIDYGFISHMNKKDKEEQGKKYPKVVQKKIKQSNEQLDRLYLVKPKEGMVVSFSEYCV